MALQTKTETSEIIIKIYPTGEVAASARQEQVVYDDESGETVSRTKASVVPLSTDSFINANTSLTDILGELATSLVDENAALKTANAALREENDLLMG